MTPTSRGTNRFDGRLDPPTPVLPARPPAIDPDAPAVPVPEPEPDPTPEPTVAELATRRPASQPTRSSRPLATEAADVVVSRRQERSFYVLDTVYARFRSAVHWTANRPDVVDDQTVPGGMSEAIEDAMRRIAEDLEQRFNGSKVFPEAPKRRRRRGEAE